MLMCKRNGTALYVVNARMTDKTHAAYRKLKAAFSGVNPKKIFATREKDKEHYQEIFPQSECAFMHNMKFDGIYHELLLAMQEKRKIRCRLFLTERHAFIFLPLCAGKKRGNLFLLLKHCTGKRKRARYA